MEWVFRVVYFHLRLFEGLGLILSPEAQSSTRYVITVAPDKAR